MSTSRTMRCQVFVDPLYGSDRYVTFEPEWVEEAEDRMKPLLFRRPRPVTYIRFKNGEEHVVDGHWAERIRAAQAEQKP